MNQSMDLKQIFVKLITNFKNDDTFAHQLWEPIEKAYNEPQRHYHNLEHIRYMVHKALEIESLISNMEVLLFSIYYHDIVYKTTKSNNELKSAELAEKVALEAGMSTDSARLCYRQILATKAHEFSENQDTNYLTDIDLCILGESPEDYNRYAYHIRKEYQIYPGFMYRKGRKKVVRHFLDMDQIFKTTYFFEKYESQARTNLNRELATL